jgi:hypothetical protein
MPRDTKKGKKNENPLIGRAILENGKLISSKFIVHNEKCEGKGLGELGAEQIDRGKRDEIATCTGNIKTLWREVILFINFMKEWMKRIT